MHTVRRERLEKLQQHVLKLGVHPSAFLPVVCDITKDAEVAALPKIVAKRWPDCGIDVLVSEPSGGRALMGIPVLALRSQFL